MPIKKRIYSRAELQDLVDAENSCVTVRSGEIDVLLHPWFMNKVQEGLWNSLYNKLKTYDSRLEGIVIGYDELKSSFEKAEFFGPNAEILYPIQGKIYLFQPMIGSKLTGYVTVVSEDHIRILLHKYFTVTVDKPKHESIAKWKKRSIKVGDRVKFSLTELDYTDEMPNMESSIETVEVLGIDTPKKKKIRKKEAADVISSTQLPGNAASGEDGSGLDFDFMSPILETKPDKLVSDHGAGPSRTRSINGPAVERIADAEAFFSPLRRLMNSTESVGVDEIKKTQEDDLIGACNRAERKKSKKRALSDIQEEGGSSISKSAEPSLKRAQSKEKRVVREHSSGQSQDQVDSQEKYSSQSYSKKDKKKIKRKSAGVWIVEDAAAVGGWTSQSTANDSDCSAVVPVKKRKRIPLDDGDVSLRHFSNGLPKESDKDSGGDFSSPPEKKSRKSLEKDDRTSTELKMSDGRTVYFKGLSPKKKSKTKSGNVGIKTMNMDSSMENLEQVASPKKKRDPSTPKQKTSEETTEKRLISLNKIGLESFIEREIDVEPEKQTKKAKQLESPKNAMDPSSLEKKKKKKKATNETTEQKVISSQKKNHFDSVIETEATGESDFVTEEKEQVISTEIGIKKKGKRKNSRTSPGKDHLDSVTERVAAGELSYEENQPEEDLNEQIKQVASLYKSNISSPKKNKKSGREKEEGRYTSPQKYHLDSVIEKVAAGELSCEENQPDEDLNEQIKQVASLDRSNLSSPKKKKKPCEEKKEVDQATTKKSNHLDSVIERVAAGGLTFEENQPGAEVTEHVKCVASLNHVVDPSSPKKKKGSSEEKKEKDHATPKKSNHLDSVIERVAAGGLTFEENQPGVEVTEHVKRLACLNHVVDPSSPKKKKGSSEKKKEKDHATPKKSNHLDSVIERVAAGNLSFIESQPGGDLTEHVKRVVSLNHVMDPSSPKKKKGSSEEKKEEAHATPKKSNHLDSVIERVAAGNLSFIESQPEEARPKKAKKAISPKKKVSTKDQETEEEHKIPKKNVLEYSAIERVAAGESGNDEELTKQVKQDASLNKSDLSSAKKKKKSRGEKKEENHTSPKNNHLDSVIETVAAGEFDNIEELNKQVKQDASLNKSDLSSAEKKKKSRGKKKEENHTSPKKNHLDSVIETVAAGEFDNNEELTKQVKQVASLSKSDLSSPKKKKKSGEEKKKVDATPKKSNHLDSVIERVAAGDLTQTELLKSSKMSHLKSVNSSVRLSSEKKKKESSEEKKEDHATLTKSNHLDSIIERVAAGDLTQTELLKSSKMSHLKSVNSSVHLSSEKKKKISSEEKKEDHATPTKSNHLDSVIERVASGDLSQEGLLKSSKKSHLKSVSSFVDFSSAKKKSSEAEKDVDHATPTKSNHLDSVIERVAAGENMSQTELKSSKRVLKKTPKKSHLKSVIKMLPGENCADSAEDYLATSSEKAESDQKSKQRSQKKRAADEKEGINQNHIDSIIESVVQGVNLEENPAETVEQPPKKITASDSAKTSRSGKKPKELTQRLSNIAVIESVGATGVDETNMKTTKKAKGGKDVSKKRKSALSKKSEANQDDKDATFYLRKLREALEKTGQGSELKKLLHEMTHSEN